jgi:PAS domain S-box-containing protein
MLSIVSDYFGSSGFMPHGYCFLWSPSLLWVDVASDLITAASYLSIPFALWYFVQRRPDLPFRWVFVMFGAFVLACGSTHLFAVWNIWHADYWPEAAAKALTAGASIATAILLWPLIPKALAIPSGTQLENANRALQNEVVLRNQAEGSLIAANQDLERRVAERTAELEKAANSARESERHFRETLENVHMIAVALDAQGNVTFCNDFLLELSGWRRDELLGQNWFETMLPDHASMLAMFEQFIRDGNIELHIENEILTRRGERRMIRWNNTVLRDSGNRILGSVSLGEDITERKVTEAKIQRLTQLYAVLSQCNQAIVRCTREEELFPQICRVAVQYGGMKMAWIGVMDPNTRMVRPVASFGDHADSYLKGIEISVDANSALGRGPTGTALRENQPVWCQDFGNDPRTAPWHPRGAPYGWGASASLPIHRNGVPVDVITLYAGEVGAFDEAVRQLLVEMATDIDFALDNFAREAARERAQQNLRAAEEQFRGLVEQSIAGTYIVQDGKFAYANPRYAEIFGYGSADELIDRDFLSMVAEKDRDVVAENIRRRIEGEIHEISYEFTGLRKDGSTVDIGVHGARATHHGRAAVIGLIQDISEKKRAEEQIQRYLKQLRTAFMSTVEVATSLSEMRDPYTAGHERRVGKIAAAIGAELGFDEQRIEGLRVAGFLHDIGKITIPAEILSKPGKLSPIEYRLIQAHPQSGYDVLKDVEFPWPVAEVALQHHERIDGSGYPQGLKGEAILLEARIMAVADVMEAMSSHRPYRPGLGIDKALAEIERGRGSAYDSAVADACLKLFREKGDALLA